MFEEDAVPNVFSEDTALNYKIMEHSDSFAVCEQEEKPKPTPDEVEANKQKWGYVPYTAAEFSAASLGVSATL